MCGRGNVSLLRVAILIAGAMVPIAAPRCEPSQAARPLLPVFMDRPELSPDENTWRTLGPLALLAVLQRHAGQTLHLSVSPPGWITATDLAGLRDLANSDVPAAVTCPFFAAHAPPATAVSTVGKEAGIMIRAAERGWNWPTSCSDLVSDARRP